jgi:hypothetical protein
MKEAKIKLSEEELLLVQNASVILTKNAVMQKAISLFGMLAEDMNATLEKASIPEEVKMTTPKISRGENYKGLPYVILDYPRLFTYENIFAVRTMFWWGNYFSITLHLKGIYKDMYQAAINESSSLLAEKQFNICMSSDQWRHELEGDNYISLSRITEKEILALIQKNQFLKLSAKVEFAQWDDSAIKLTRLFGEILRALALF